VRHVRSRCATSDPGCPHPRLPPALGTKHKALQHCLSIDGKGGWDRQKSNTSVVKAKIAERFAFPRIKENAVEENRSEKIIPKKDFPQKINFQRKYAAALRGVAALS